MKQDKMVKHDSMKANDMANKSHKDAHAQARIHRKLNQIYIKSRRHLKTA